MSYPISAAALYALGSACAVLICAFLGFLEGCLIFGAYALACQIMTLVYCWIAWKKHVEEERERSLAGSISAAEFLRVRQDYGCGFFAETYLDAGSQPDLHIRR